MAREAALQPRAKSLAAMVDPLAVLKKRISKDISGPGELLLKYKNFKSKVRSKDRMNECVPVNI